MAKRTTAPSYTTKPQKNPFVGIAGAIGGTLIAMIAIISIFIPEAALGIIPPVAWAMAVLGVFLGFFAYKKQ